MLLTLAIGFMLLAAAIYFEPYILAKIKSMWRA